MRISIFSLFLAFSVFIGGTTFAEVTVTPVSKFVVSLSSEEAKTFGRAFGLREPTVFQEFSLKPTPTLSFEGNLRGSSTGSGYSLHRYTGKVIMDVSPFDLSGSIEKGAAVVSLIFDDARKVYEAMIGIKEVPFDADGIAGFNKNLEVRNLSLSCTYNPQGFNHHECVLNISIK